MDNEQMKAIYTMAKAIYNKRESLTEGARRLYLTHEINPNSFADYYRAFQKMLDGGLHARSIGSDLRDYFLSRILQDYGASKLRTALDAYKASIEYYEKTHRTNRKREWEIYNKYNNLLNSHSSNP